jgi:F-type H+-transporting ATPase subunit epsilon
MNTFKLNVATPDGRAFSGDAASITVKTTEGEVQLLAAHADYLAALGVGVAKIVLPDGSVKTASVSGGFISCAGGTVDVVATTVEFSEQIDLERAKTAKEKAEKMITEAKDSKTLEIAKAKLSRALARISVSGKK